jgi:ABC-type amino acid transport substrate-binding protein
MKFFKTLLSITLVALAAFNNPAAAQGAPAKSRLQTIMERGTLRVGTTGDFNPMSIRDAATNTYRGFDVEAMEQLARDMGVKVEWVPAEWATLVAGITSNRYDILNSIRQHDSDTFTITCNRIIIYLIVSP